MSYETEGQIVYPNQAAEIAQKKKIIELLKAKMHKEIGEEKPVNIYKSDFKCYWCKQKLPPEDEYYYHCKQHNHKFCDNCAHNFYKKEIKRDEAPKCKETLYEPHDCIYEKINLGIEDAKS